MDKTQNTSVESLALKIFEWHRCRSVYRIAQKRMADAGHVYPDLVGSSCFQASFDMSIATETLKHPVMSHCLFSVSFIDAHLFPVRRIPSYGPVDGALIFF